MKFCYDVKSSVLGRAWHLMPVDERLALTLSQQHNIPDIVGRLLALREVGIDHAGPFLNPNLNQLPDPALLQDVEKAVAVLMDAIKNKIKIGIFGDYDVDGATSTALLLNYLRALDVPVAFHIPDRKSEGYGPNLQALQKLQAEGAKTVVTVDCGITSSAILEQAMADGLQIVVIDHHIPGPDLPKAQAVVNPNRMDDQFPDKNLAACGVVFMVLIALNRRLRESGFFATRPEPDLRKSLDLVALGTVADVVPLVGLNRLLVSKGLEVLSRRENIGLRVLCDIAGVKERIDAYHLGFILGPRINAGGRIGKSDLGTKLLTTQDEFEARDIAAQLHRLNAERQDIEGRILQESIMEVEAKEVPWVIVMGKQGWHPGVIGIVASRLKERFNRPACVIALEEKDGEMIGTGSARSVNGFDLGSHILAAVQTGLLIKGGGHAMAAGFTVKADNIPALQKFLEDRFKQVMTEDMILPSLRIDACLSVTAANQNLLRTLERLAPFGTSNPAPRFAIDQVRVAYADIVGEKHVRARLEGIDGTQLKAIAFRATETALGQHLLKSKGALLRVAGQLKADNFNGKSGIQFIIDDVA
jgi:single-stranded-DNA-specific exonuclease